MQLQQKARRSPDFSLLANPGAVGPGKGGLFSWPPSLRALLVQVLATILTAALLLPLFERWGFFPTSLTAAFFQAGLAALLGHRFGQAKWWLIIHLLFAPALIWALSLGIAPSWFLAAFLALFLVYWSVFRSQVPLYLSSRQAHAAIADLLPNQGGFSFLDLGAGLGGVLAYLSKSHPQGNYCGMEIAPLPFAIAWLRKTAGGAPYTVSRDDFWEHPLTPYDVVYAYLSPVPMDRLWRKACAEMRPGSSLISNTFTIPGLQPEKIVELEDFHLSRLYVYRVPPARAEQGET